MQTRYTLSLDEAKSVAAAAATKATAEGWRVVIAIVDIGGHLVYLERLDGTQIGSIQVALEKARTAIYFNRSTKVFEDVVQGGRTNMLNLQGATPIEGGLPLRYEGEIVGAIGISGVTAAQDGQVAQAGAEVLERLA
ncbi:MAG TPA: heme-binding protein [Povalibacter sp.]|nr:heme-binding protein [Povalibacter sp.]